MTGRSKRKLVGNPDKAVFGSAGMVADGVGRIASGLPVAVALGVLVVVVGMVLGVLFMRASLLRRWVRVRR
jgi:hypothetical protein